MIRVIIRGGMPTSIRRSLERAGLVLGETGDIVLVWYDGRDQRDDSVDGGNLANLAPRDEPVVAMVPRPDLVEAALRNGATDVLTSLPPAAELYARLGALMRYAERWRQRVSAQARRGGKISEEMVRARALLDQMLIALPDPVIVCDLRGRVLRANGGVERLLGYPPHEAVKSLHVTDIYADPNDARRVYAEIRASKTGVVELPDTRLRARSGEHIPVRLFAGELQDAQGEPSATFGIIQDQREVQALRRRLEDATNRLIVSEERMAAIQGAGSVAHELNQPLTAVMGALELLELRADLPADARVRLQRAYAQLERMARIVRELAQTTRRLGASADGEPRAREST